MIQSVGLVLNHENPKALFYAEKAAGYLTDHGIICSRPQKETVQCRPDLVVSFGGDGTLLYGARFALQYDAPLLGINLGTVGFLTEEEPENLHNALDAIMDGKYQIEYRSTLRVYNTQTGEAFYALNDAVITRGGYARLIRVDASVNDKEYASFTADGIIISTPTGSTGYSLSAGGPIIEPGMNCMIITPVCPHSMKHCPCIVSGTSDIRMKLNPDRVQTAELQIDGRNMGRLTAGDEIHIIGADKRIQLVRLHPYDFFALMRKKLSEWGS